VLHGFLTEATGNTITTSAGNKPGFTLTTSVGKIPGGVGATMDGAMDGTFGATTAGAGAGIRMAGIMNQATMPTKAEAGKPSVVVVDGGVVGGTPGSTTGPFGNTVLWTPGFTPSVGKIPGGVGATMAGDGTKCTHGLGLTGVGSGCQVHSSTRLAAGNGNKAPVAGSGCGTAIGGNGVLTGVDGAMDGPRGAGNGMMSGDGTTSPVHGILCLSTQATGLGNTMARPGSMDTSLETHGCGTGLAGRTTGPTDGSSNGVLGKRFGLGIGME